MLDTSGVNLLLFLLRLLFDVINFQVLTVHFKYFFFFDFILNLISFLSSNLLNFGGVTGIYIKSLRYLIQGYGLL